MSRTQDLAALYVAYFSSRPVSPLMTMVIQPRDDTCVLPKLETWSEPQPTYRQHHKPSKRRALKKIRKASQKRNRK